MKADLHVHTTASDGRHSPEEIVRLAVDAGLDVIAITDHDSVDGIDPALLVSQEFPGLKVVPGVEVSTDVRRGEVHVLGYFINHRDPEFVDRLESLRDSRRLRGRKMVDKLAGLGVHIDWSRVQEIAGGGSIGRPHIAQAMLEGGYVLSPKEAFVKYIGREGPAYVKREKLTPEQVVELIVRAGGLPVLAHPADIEGLEGLIGRLQKVGLAGIETYYDGYAPRVVQYLVSLASKYGLIACGGSDYHGLEKVGETPVGGVAVPPECVDRLFALARRKNLASL